MATNRPDIYQRVTDDVLAFLRDNPDPGSSGTPWRTAGTKCCW